MASRYRVMGKRSIHPIAAMPILPGFLLLLFPLLVLSSGLGLAASLEGEVEIWEKRGTQPVRLENRENAVIFVAGFKEAPPEDQLPQLIQKDKSFSQRVLVITQGETVEFPNMDKILHNVWSKSKAGPFDLGLYAFPEKKPVRFTNQGIISVFCNIHAQMISTILVLPNQRHFTTGPDGRFRIEGIPAGKHTVYAWVEGAVPLKREAVFQEGKVVTMDFKLMLQRIPLRHLNKDGRPYKSYNN